MRLLLLLLLLSFNVTAQYHTTVYFDFDKYILTPKAMQALDTLANNIRISSITITGHTDQLGSKEYNYKLSMQRAHAVRDYLAGKGFPASSIDTLQAMGEDEPAIDKLDAISRSANRRVTIVSVLAPQATTAVITTTQPVLQPMGFPEHGDTVLFVPPQPAPIQPTLEETIRDTAVKEGQNILLKNINFYGGSHRFLPQSLRALDELLAVMRNIPSLEIEIQGHICCTDNRDGYDYDVNDNHLSRNRARAVYEFLIESGISKKRMSYKGFGHRFPLYPYERNEFERTGNRRVEIKIVRK